MSREPQTLQWSHDPPDAEGTWLVSVRDNLWSIYAYMMRKTLVVRFPGGQPITPDEFANHYYPNARYARIAGPEE